MFTFFHKKEKIILDAFTDDAVAFNCVPIVKATKLFPDWWKELNDPGIGNAINNIETNPISTNMKRCYGFIEFFKKSFILRNGSDLHVRVGKDSYEYYCLITSKPGFHAKHQYEKGFPNHLHIKITSPWVLGEKTGVYFVNIGAEWNLDTYNIKILPGIDNYIIPSYSNVNIMLPKSNQEKYNIYFPIGLPLYHIIPLTEKKVELKRHLVTSSELAKISYKPLRTLKKFDELVKLAKQNICPFGEN